MTYQVPFNNLEKNMKHRISWSLPLPLHTHQPAQSSSDKDNGEREAKWGVPAFLSSLTLAMGNWGCGLFSF